MPRWVQQKLNDVDAELEGERAQRETAEAHGKTLRAQISKEAKIQQELKGGRDSALAEVAELKDALHAQIAKQADTEQGLKTERDRALADAAKLKATVEGLSRARPEAETRWAKEPMKRWLAPIAVGIVLLTALLGGTLVSLWPSRKSDAQAETKVAELTATVTKSDKARQDAERRADQATAALGKSEQARQVAEAKADDAEKARQVAAAKADGADKSRLATEAKAVDADKARQAAEAKLAQADVQRVSALNGFNISFDTDVDGQAIDSKGSDTMDQCLQRCASMTNCRVFTYTPNLCWSYESGTFSRRLGFVSGRR
jgi:hypothetical protein